MRGYLMSDLFLHERLEAYRAARRLARVVHQLVDQMPKGNAGLADQITRAVRSSRLAIAEGANTRVRKSKVLYFDRAVASSGECAACLDEVEDLRLAPPDLIERARHELGITTRCTLGLIHRHR
jgi:four helix bundle protein